MGDTPTSPGIRLRRIALAILSWLPRSDVLACGRPSLVRYYVHTEQVPLILNTYREVHPGTNPVQRIVG